MAEPGRGPGGRRYLVVLKGYPRVSETFIAQEILGLQGSTPDQTAIDVSRVASSISPESFRKVDTARILFEQRVDEAHGESSMSSLGRMLVSVTKRTNFFLSSANR